MKSLPASSSSPEFIRFTKQQLLGMHALIKAKQVPVSKSQDFFEQIGYLDLTLTDQPYTTALNRYRTRSKVLLLIKIAFIASLIAFGISFLFPNNPSFAGAAQQLASVSTITLPTVTGILTALLLLVFIVCLRSLQSLSDALTGKYLSQWWLIALQRWMPELAVDHDISALAPDAIAHLVAVHAKIKDVDLELKSEKT